jgi:hypothetical protein
VLNNIIGMIARGGRRGDYFYLSSFEDLVEGNFHMTHCLKNILELLLSMENGQ